MGEKRKIKNHLNVVEAGLGNQTEQGEKVANGIWIEFPCKDSIKEPNYCSSKAGLWSSNPWLMVVWPIAWVYPNKGPLNKKLTIPSASGMYLKMVLSVCIAYTDEFWKTSCYILSWIRLLARQLYTSCLSLEIHCYLLKYLSSSTTYAVIVTVPWAGLLYRLDFTPIVLSHIVITLLRVTILPL